MINNDSQWGVNVSMIKKWLNMIKMIPKDDSM